jgi:hypothetical protein
MNTIDLPMIVLLIAAVLVLLGLVLVVLFMIRSRRGGLIAGQGQALSPEQERAIMLYPHDGIADIYIGLTILVFGLLLFTSMPWLAGALVASYVALYRASKLSFTGPRIHRITLTPARGGGGVIILIILLILGVAALIGGLFLSGLASGNRLSPETWDSLVYGLKLAAGVGAALLWAIAAFLGEVKRYYGYALLTLTLAAGVLLLGAPFRLAVILLGLVVFIAGLAILYRFVHRYPVTA